MKKILLLEGIHPGAKKHLESFGFKVETEKVALQGKALLERAQGFHALGVRSKSQIRADILAGLPELEVIGCFCIGTDQVDLNDSNRLGIPVFNAPYSNTRSVAELVISEMIALSRRLCDRSRQMHQGVWQKSAVGAHEVRGKTLGIIGYGHIGSQLSVLAESMGLHVIFYDIVKKLPLGNARLCASMDELLSQADFVTLHVPDTQLTRNMITKRELGLMRPNSYLINASRGQVVNIPDLAEALRSKHLAGAAVDVFPVEPSSNAEVFNSELQELENVILTPHIGGSTEEAQEAIGYEVSESLLRYLLYGATTGAVNFPQIDVGPAQVGRRLVNVHRNVPGVLGRINSIISNLGGNIVGQYLSTDAQIGYLIMDLELKDPQSACSQVKALETSIRTALK